VFGLINAIIRDFLGKYGGKLLDLVLSNSSIICLVVVLYGTVLIFARRNMEKIGKEAKSLEDGSIFSEREPFSALASRDAMFWDQLRKVSRFPFITLPSSLLLYRVTRTNTHILLAKYIVYRQRQERINRPRQKT
jgi:hypothetical protein